MGRKMSRIMRRCPRKRKPISPPFFFIFIFFTFICCCCCCCFDLDRMEHSPIWWTSNSRGSSSCKYYWSPLPLHSLWSFPSIRISNKCSSPLLFHAISPQLVVLYVDFKLDESYTPSKISVRAGDGFHNLKAGPIPLFHELFEMRFQTHYDNK